MVENNKDPYENIRKRIEYAEAQMDRAVRIGTDATDAIMLAQVAATLAQAEMLMELDSTLDQLVRAYSMVHFS